MCESRDGSMYLGRWKDNNYHAEGFYLYEDG